MPQNITEQLSREQQIAALEKDWANNPRWKGVKRGYTAEDVVRHMRDCFLAIMSPDLVLLPADRVQELVAVGRELGLDVHGARFAVHERHQQEGPLLGLQRVQRAGGDGDEPAGPIAVIPRRMFPLCSNTGAQIALMPGMGSPCTRAMPRLRTSASRASSSCTLLPGTPKPAATPLRFSCSTMRST